MRSISALVGALAYRATLPMSPPATHFDAFVASLQRPPGLVRDRAELWITYQQWCLLNAEAPVSPERFGRAMDARLPMVRPRREAGSAALKAAHS